MKKGFFATAVSLLCLSGIAVSQELPTKEIADPAAAGVVGTRICDCSFADPPSRYQIWGSAEYLLWWTKSDHLQTPLVVTTNNPNAVDANGNSVAGGLGRPGTSVLLGGNDISFGSQSGAKFVVGAWIDSDNTVGFEARGFFLQPGSLTRSFASGPAGSPLIGIPVNLTQPVNVINPVNGIILTQNRGENAIAESFPGTFAGGDTVISHTTLWGAEANGVFNLVRNDRWSVDLIGGFRYADLRDDITLAGESSNLVPVAGLGGVAFLNNFYNGTVVSQDYFETRNQFYGGQVGVKAEAIFGRLFVGIDGQLAMGATHQTLDIRGNSTLITGGGIMQTNSGGTLALASNIGSYSRNQFSVIPEVDLKLGMNFTERIRGFIGYNFMYWSNVARAGDQIDRNVDIRQIPTVPAYDPTLRTQPVAQINNSGFWAQGITLGIEFRY